LCIKVEIDNTEKEKALSLFLNNKISLLSANESKHKKYSEIYSDLKKLIKFEQSYLDEVYSSKYVTYFYAKEEIESFKKRWLKKEIVDAD
jgi:hypothetical protein